MHYSTILLVSASMAFAALIEQAKRALVEDLSPDAVAVRFVCIGNYKSMY